MRELRKSLLERSCSTYGSRCTIALTAAIVLLAGLFTQPVSAISYDEVYTQNTAGAAVFYDAPADDTECFNMSEDEFEAYKAILETRLVYAYGTYYNSLKGSAQESLKESQKAWIDCYEVYTDALAQLWKEYPVKIYFDVPKHVRRTNVYREILLLLLINRITDLEEWNEGRLVGLEDVFLEEKQAELTEGHRLLQVHMGLCNYVISEEYRPLIFEAHRKYFTFYDSNKAFLEQITDDEAIITAECLLQIDRMEYINGVHYQGCRFFRREREE